MPRQYQLVRKTEFQFLEHQLYFRAQCIFPVMCSIPNWENLHCTIVTLLSHMVFWKKKSPLRAQLCSAGNCKVPAAAYSNSPTHAADVVNSMSQRCVLFTILQTRSHAFDIYKYEVFEYFDFRFCLSYLTWWSRVFACPHVSSRGLTCPTRFHMF